MNEPGARMTLTNVIAFTGMILGAVSAWGTFSGGEATIAEKVRTDHDRIDALVLTQYRADLAVRDLELRDQRIAELAERVHRLEGRRR